MYVRLAFAVAAHLEPEILIVDEVLAVGDSAFQQKCLGKMEEVGREGRTVLFVSHNMQAIQSLCATAIHLKGGQVVEWGNSQSIVAHYLASTSKISSRASWTEETAPGNDEVKLTAIQVCNEDYNTDGIYSSKHNIILMEFTLVNTTFV